MVDVTLQQPEECVRNAEGQLQSTLGESNGTAGIKIKGEVRQGQAVAIGASRPTKWAADRRRCLLQDQHIHS